LLDYGYSCYVYSFYTTQFTHYTHFWLVCTRYTVHTVYYRFSLLHTRFLVYWFVWFGLLWLVWLVPFTLHTPTHGLHTGLVYTPFGLPATFGYTQVLRFTQFYSLPHTFCSLVPTVHTPHTHTPRFVHGSRFGSVRLLRFGSFCTPFWLHTPHTHTFGLVYTHTHCHTHTPGYTVCPTHTTRLPHFAHGSRTYHWVYTGCLQFCGYPHHFFLVTRFSHTRYRFWVYTVYVTHSSTFTSLVWLRLVGSHFGSHGFTPTAHHGLVLPLLLYPTPFGSFGLPGLGSRPTVATHCHVYRTHTRFALDYVLVCAHTVPTFTVLHTHSLVYLHTFTHAARFGYPAFTRFYCVYSFTTFTHTFTLHTHGLPFTPHAHTCVPTRLVYVYVGLVWLVYRLVRFTFCWFGSGSVTHPLPHHTTFGFGLHCAPFTRLYAPVCTHAGLLRFTVCTRTRCFTAGLVAGLPAAFHGLVTRTHARLRRFHGLFYSYCTRFGFGWFSLYTHTQFYPTHTLHVCIWFWFCGLVTVCWFCVYAHLRWFGSTLRLYTRLPGWLVYRFTFTVYTTGWFWVTHRLVCPIFIFYWFAAPHTLHTLGLGSHTHTRFTPHCGCCWLDFGSFARCYFPFILVVGFAHVGCCGLVYHTFGLHTHFVYRLFTHTHVHAFTPVWFTRCGCTVGFTHILRFLPAATRYLRLPHAAHWVRATATPRTWFTHRFCTWVSRTRARTPAAHRFPCRGFTGLRTVWFAGWFAVHLVLRTAPHTAFCFYRFTFTHTRLHVWFAARFTTFAVHTRLVHFGSTTTFALAGCYTRGWFGLGWLHPTPFTHGFVYARLPGSFGLVYVWFCLRFGLRTHCVYTFTHARTRLRTRLRYRFSFCCYGSPFGWLPFTFTQFYWFTHLVVTLYTFTGLHTLFTWLLQFTFCVWFAFGLQVYILHTTHLRLGYTLLCGLVWFVHTHAFATRYGLHTGWFGLHTPWFTVWLVLVTVYTRYVWFTRCVAHVWFTAFGSLRLRFGWVGWFGWVTRAFSGLVWVTLFGLRSHPTLPTVYVGCVYVYIFTHVTLDGLFWLLVGCYPRSGGLPRFTASHTGSGYTHCPPRYGCRFWFPTRFTVHTPGLVYWFGFTHTCTHFTVYTHTGLPRFCRLRFLRVTHTRAFYAHRTVCTNTVRTHAPHGFAVLAFAGYAAAHTHAQHTQERTVYLCARVWFLRAHAATPHGLVTV